MDEDFVNTLLGVSWPIIPAFLSWLKGDTLWVRLPLAGVGIGVVAVVTTFTGLWSVSPVDIGGVAFLIMANWALGVISALRVLVRFASLARGGSIICIPKKRSGARNENTWRSQRVGADSTPRSLLSPHEQRSVASEVTTPHRRNGETRHLTSWSLLRIRQGVLFRSSHRFHECGYGQPDGTARHQESS